MQKTFFDYIEFEKRYSKHTITSYKTDLKQFSIFVEKEFEETDLTGVNYPMIRTWIVSLMDKGIEAKSVNRKIATLKSFYKFLLRNEHIEKNPTLKIIAPKVKKRLPSFIEEQNLEKLFDQLNYSKDFGGIRDKLVLELLYGTGIRLSELINLNEKSINFSDLTIKVLGKGNKERIIPLNDNLLITIKSYIKSKNNENFGNKTNLFIVTNNGTKSYPTFIYRLVKKYLSIVTTSDKKNPHTLRHSFATHLLNKGADLNAVKDLLGHTSLAATQVYTHNSVDKLKRIFEQAHPKA